MFDNSKNFYTFVTDQNENIMTDYERLIKEARTLEGLYFKGDKLTQGYVIPRSEDSFSVSFMDIKGIRIHETDWFIYIEDAIKELNNLRKLCYKPLTKVFTFSSDAKHIDECKIHRSACYFLQSLNQDVDVNIAFTDEDITPIEEIHEEIRRILN